MGIIRIGKSPAQARPVPGASRNLCLYQNSLHGALILLGYVGLYIVSIKYYDNSFIIVMATGL